MGLILVLLTCSVATGLAQTASASPAPAQTSPIRKILLAPAVIDGNVAHEVLPKYPVEALSSGIQGDVIFRIEIDETGKVILAVPVKGNPLLVASSIEALRDLRYHPYVIQSFTVRVDSETGFHFSLKGTETNAKGRVERLTGIASDNAFRTGVTNDKDVLTLWPVKISGTEPQLPPELSGKLGSVYITVIIGEDGKVQDVKVISGNEEFVPAVVTAVKQYVYEPQFIGGK